MEIWRRCHLHPVKTKFKKDIAPRGIQKQTAQIQIQKQVAMMMQTCRLLVVKTDGTLKLEFFLHHSPQESFYWEDSWWYPLPVLVTQRWPDVLCLYCLCCFYWLCWRLFVECWTICCKYGVVPVPLLDASCDVFLGRIISCKYIVVPLLLCCQKDARRPPGNQNPPSYYSDPP